MVGDRGPFPSIGGLSPFPVNETSLSLDFSGFRMGVGGASLFFETFFSLAGMEKEMEWFQFVFIRRYSDSY